MIELQPPPDVQMLAPENRQKAAQAGHRSCFLAISISAAHIVISTAVALAVSPPLIIILNNGAVPEALHSPRFAFRSENPLSFLVPVCIFVLLLLTSYFLAKSIKYHELAWGSYHSDRLFKFARWARFSIFIALCSITLQALLTSVIFASQNYRETLDVLRWLISYGDIVFLSAFLLLIPIGWWYSSTILPD